MANNNNRKYEIDERAWEIIRTNLKTDLLKYMPTPQDQKMLDRKIDESLNRSKVEVKEKITDGRTDDTASSIAVIANG